MIPGDAPAKPRVREPSVQGTESCPGAEILRWRRELRALGGDPRSLDWLLDAAGGLTPSLLQALLLHPERSVTLLTAKRAVEALWRQHVVDAVPLQYSVGHCHWRDVVIGVGPGVLIPRPETELLVDLAMEFWGEAASLSSDGLLWADLGTGSGCLALALALAFPARQGLAVDVSRVALDRAHHNLAVADLLSRVRVVEGHWLQALQPWWGRLALVVANPPYIPSGVVDQLEPVVRDHEPRLALDGGQDGLDCLRDIVASAPQALAPGGWLLLEHHHDQGQRVLDLLAQHGLVDGQSHADLNGHRRFASGRRPFSKADFTSPSRS
ncbi:MAG: peptide chain release factor N(5)-glutamine methyltransferase [Cyanobacteria bacterium K_Offshore_surface_m2_239]|nr:peptide chain release factor N(5)-glutamine methyltransferase [Cyanobacteria bacterium K_Offshore_surface_m2_239]